MSKSSMMALDQREKFEQGIIRKNLVKIKAVLLN